VSVIKSSTTQGFTLLPEWHPQSATLITWPHQHSDWGTEISLPSNTIETFYLELVGTICRHQACAIICYDLSHKQHIIELLRSHDVKFDTIYFYIIPTNDTWIRDYGPLSTISSKQSLHLLNFEFNAWGNKYGFDQDNLVNLRLNQQHAFNGASFLSLPWILEGGSIDTDGQGTILTTTRCLLSKNRNPEQCKASVEQGLGEYLGARKVLWLDHGFLEGDDTDAHVDTLARFTNPDTLCYVSCDQPEDPHYHAMQSMEKTLKTFCKLNGEPYKLVPLPWPKPKINHQGERLPTTYANFLIINNAVLVPTYNDPADERALGIFRELFPERQVIGLNCSSLIEQFGSLHCATMQLPEGIELQ